MKATMGIRMAAAGMAAIGAVWLLSYLPSPRGMGERAVFHVHQPSLMDQQGLVDRLSGLQLDRKVTRAEWTGAVLKIDLDATGTGPEGKLWLEDIRRLADISFVQTVNVNRLLVRMEDGDGSLLASADLRRSDSWISVDELKDWSGINLNGNMLWKARLRLTYHDGWSKSSADIH